MNSSVLAFPAYPTSFPTGSFLDEVIEVEVTRNYAVVIAAILATVPFFVSFQGKKDRLDAPVVGYRWFWEPAWLLRLRFITNSFSMLTEGYTKYKDRIFIVRRTDTDIAIISTKYIDEIRKLPEDVISVTEAHIQNLVGEYSGVDIARTSDLHNRALLRELTPNIGLFIPWIKDELDFAIRTEMPQTEDWVKVDITEVLLRIIARVSARVFVGLPLCRDPEWLKLSMETTVNAFGTAMGLRMLPSFLHMLHPAIVRLLPTWYRLHKNRRVAERLVAPILEQHAKDRANGVVNEDKISSLLTWMKDFAVTEEESAQANLAERQIMIGLGSIHTIKNAVAHLMYDLCAHPEYMGEMREEVENVFLAGGQWDKPTLTKLWKLESLMTESQRVNPPQLMSFYHRTLKPITLSDGTFLPAHTQLAIPAASMLFDPAITPNPEAFDPLRSYRARLEPGESIRHQYTKTSKTHMHFGHGKHACPGRAFAVNEVKMIVAALLIGFEFKQVNGEGRPRNIMLDEFVFPTPGACLMVRRRAVREGVPALGIVA